jgi:hypothetical protein
MVFAYGLNRQTFWISLDQLGQILDEGRRLAPLDNVLVGGEVTCHCRLT